MTQSAASPGAPQGNQNAVKAKRIRDALLKELGRAGSGDVDKGLEPIVKKIIKLAKDGEQWAVQEVFNRIEGRVAQSVEMSGPNGGDLVIRDANTTLGIARRVAFVLAQGALARAQLTSKEAVGDGADAAVKGEQR